MGSNLLALLSAVAALLAVGCDDGQLYGSEAAKQNFSSSHSLRNSYLVVSEASPRLPQFIAAGYVDGERIFHYDSNTQKMIPVASWMSKVMQDYPQLRNKKTQKLPLTKILETLLGHFRHSHSTGLHTLQLMFSCEMLPDGRPGRLSWKYAYDGKDLLDLNMEIPTWRLLEQQDKILKLDHLLDDPLYCRRYLEDNCMYWLKTYLGYRNVSLQRKETLTGKLARKKGSDRQETLFCLVYGVYPKEINVTWMKVGKEQMLARLTECILPNSDGTYYTSLSINVEPEERDQYFCRVEHNSLLKPLDLIWEEPASGANLWLILGPLGGVFILAGIILMIIVFLRKRRREGGKIPTPRDNDKVSNCSTSRDSGLSTYYSGDGESGQVSCFNGDGDSGQVSYQFRDGDSDQES